MLATTVVGSYPQPEWLIDRSRLRGQLPPRIRAHELWRIPQRWLEQAQDDATVLAVRDLEQAGIDIVSDGEIRRESWSNRFASALDGLDLDRPGKALDAAGQPFVVPRVVGPIRRRHAVGVRDVQILRANTDRLVKVTVPGPFSLTQHTQDEHYGDERALALDFAAAVNAEVADLFAAGADVVQIDEPTLRWRPDRSRAYGVEVIDRAFAGIDGTTALHVCFGYASFGGERTTAYGFLAELECCAVQQVSIEAAHPRLDLSVLASLPSKTIVLGVLDLGDSDIETADVVAARIRAALRHVTPDRLMLAPDCGMKYLSREVAFGKLRALVQGRDIVLGELSERDGALRDRREPPPDEDP